jgi:hypothetical protein
MYTQETVDKCVVNWLEIEIMESVHPEGGESRFRKTSSWLTNGLKYSIGWSELGN